ncbi:MAG: AAA family ATPase [Chloroflexota bacterium]|nr:AAA family ATPase [Chloroflexota bacterium]
MRLEFPRGITAFVGPNGSGKSNVVDAVRWCLGEQSARDLRAQRAEDVIYAGARKVLGAAEVSLTFESEAGDDVPWAEFGVARRLLRSGESEYRINQGRVRLRDVSSGLRSIGIDAGRNVVVTQGMTDGLLSATPLERRLLLEQAAGLGPYRERRDEARQKLATTELNIQTIETVLAEMEPRLRLLRRQARAVQDRDEARELLRRRLGEWFAWRWRDVSRRRDVAKQAAGQASEARLRLANELRRLEQAAESALERERAQRRDMEAALAALHDTERERDAALYEIQQRGRDLDAARKRSAELESRTRRVAEERSASRERIESLVAVLDGLDRQHSSRETEEREVLGDLRRAGRESHVSSERVRAGAAAFEKAERSRREAAVAIRETQGQVEEERRRLGTIEHLLAEERDQLGRAEADLNAARSCVREAQEALARLETLAARAESALETAQRRLARLQRLERRAVTAANETTDQVARHRRLLGSLEELSPGMLGELEVPEVWEVAIAAALHGWDFAASAFPRSGDAADFLAWRGSLDRDLGGIPWADEVVQGLPRQGSHLLLGTLLVCTSADAESLWRRIADLPAHRIGSPPLVVVTREGVIHDALGVRSGRGDERTARFLRSRRELKRLEKRLDVLRPRTIRLAEARQELSARINADRRAASEANTLVQAARSRLSAAEKAGDRAERLLAGMSRESEERRADLDRLQARILAGDRTVSELTATTARLTVEAETRNREWMAAQRAADAADARTAKLEVRARTLREEIDTLAFRRTSQREILEHARRDEARFERQEEWLGSERSSLDMEIERLHATGDTPRAPLAELDALLLEYRRRVEALRSNDRQGRAPENLRQIRDGSTAAIGRHERALATLSQLDSEVRRLALEIAQELSCEPDELPAAPEVPPTDDEIRRLRSRATQYAEADPSIVEECRELAERQTYLQAHVKDLHQAVETLREIMEVADGEMHSRFNAAFSAVNAEFSRVFQVMLRGGEAHLERIGDEGGIDIRAQLPGRRARSSAAFSGGERALVASSLLFGVLKIRPAPFCILDEVDAALDENNVDRYLTVLRDVAERTQILLVTHNRATMEAADVLNGLTMNEDGVSSVLSLRLEAYAASAR